MSPVPVSTPCRRICCLDAERKRCIGCGRTVEAIAAWSRMSEAERLSAMAELDLDRLEAAGRPGDPEAST